MKNLRFCFNATESSSAMTVNDIVLAGQVVGRRFITDDDDWVEINGVKTPFSEWI